MVLELPRYQSAEGGGGAWAARDRNRLVTDPGTRSQVAVNNANTAAHVRMHAVSAEHICRRPAPLSELEIEKFTRFSVDRYDREQHRARQSGLPQPAQRRN
jgi:hypothetical protein